ncbi:TPA: hypothetical protein L5621_006243 [Pseudomonas aeruginosa]|nr:hypothetical protein [Pseudomonas aeruginosa]
MRPSNEDKAMSTERWLLLLGSLFLVQMALGSFCWLVLSAWRGQPVDVSGWNLVPFGVATVVMELGVGYALVVRWLARHEAQLQGWRGLFRHLHGLLPVALVGMAFAQGIVTTTWMAIMGDTPGLGWREIVPVWLSVVLVVAAVVSGAFREDRREQQIDETREPEVSRDAER